MKQTVRVLVVDDSAFARKVLCELLALALPGDRRVAVVGIARDGLEALEKIAELRPDVITLDLVMPNLDGVGVLRALPPRSRSKTLIVSFSDAESELGVEALQLGAFDLVHKPAALASVRLYEVRDELIRKVIAASDAQAGRAAAVAGEGEPLVAPPPASSRIDAVVIGTSTGGPQALTRFLTALPADFPVPLAIALHIPAGYTGALAHRLDGACAISVAEARPGMALRPGLALIAPGGSHLALARRGGEVVADLGLEPSARLPYVPSVDVLFESAARAFAGRVLAVVMTGMGEDGLAGARAVREAGGLVLAEDQSSAVVYGMPRAVWEAGLAVARVPLDRLVPRTLQLLERGADGVPASAPE